MLRTNPNSLRSCPCFRVFRLNFASDFFFIFFYLVAYLSSYHEKVIKALYELA